MKKVSTDDGTDVPRRSAIPNIQRFLNNLEREKIEIFRKTDNSFREIDAASDYFWTFSSFGFINIMFFNTFPC